MRRDDDEVAPATTLASVLEDEQSPYWARECGWLPGSGLCWCASRSDCPQNCSFREQREAEARRLQRYRQRRSTRPAVERAQLARRSSLGRQSG